MSETTAPTTEANASGGTVETTPDTGTVDHAAEAEKWKNLARKHEERAKANQTAAKELESLRQSQMTEQERAVAEAKALSRTETLREIGSHLVTAEFRAQAAGRLTPEQVAELVEDLDMTKYLTETGEVDAERVAKKVDALAPKPTEPTAPTWPDLGQGARDTSTLALNDDGLTRALAAKLGARRP
jgi:hypothetical protein